jgi:hypothetical protein
MTHMAHFTLMLCCYCSVAAAGGVRAKQPPFGGVWVSPFPPSLCYYLLPLVLAPLLQSIHSLVTLTLVTNPSNIDINTIDINTTKVVSVSMGCSSSGAAHSVTVATENGSTTPMTTTDQKRRIKPSKDAAPNNSSVAMSSNGSAQPSPSSRSQNAGGGFDSLPSPNSESKTKKTVTTTTTGGTAGPSSRAGGPSNGSGRSGGRTLNAPSRSSMKKPRELKLLILGGGEAGKSTLARQMANLHKHVLTRDQLPPYSKALHANTLTSMNALLTQAATLGNLLTPEEEKAASAVRSICSERGSMTGERELKLTPVLADQVDMLWRSEMIQKTWAKRFTFSLPGMLRPSNNHIIHMTNQLTCCVMVIIEVNAEYCFSHCRRFAKNDYIPSEEDVIMARRVGRGILFMFTHFIGASLFHVT